MKSVTVSSLKIPGLKVIRYGRFADKRGFFTETFRLEDFEKNSDINFLTEGTLVQSNESYSRAGTIRGMHFQWNPDMGKMVRCVSGHMVDLVLDVRKGSPYYGKMFAYDMPASTSEEFGEWLWVPPGFAHGNFFIEDSVIEYFCTGQYNGDCEAGISPLATDIDWSLVDPNLRSIFEQNTRSTSLLISDKDIEGLSVADWSQDKRSENFVYDVSIDISTLGDNIICTGGSGLLGQELQKLAPNMRFPLSRDFDIRDYHQMEEFIKQGSYSTIIHAAASTSPPQVERDPTEALQTNIIGTANIVQLCQKYRLKLIYISTDYVFSGEEGNYSEEDPVKPINKYAWSKLGGECAVQMYDKSLIIRTTFGEKVFPYEKAFVDQWTSREVVDVVAQKILQMVVVDAEGVIHVGGTKKTVYEYAKSLNERKQIGELSRNDVSFMVPKDTSLNITKFNLIIGGSN